MIRRDATNSEGLATWLLIDQTEHARIAGTLADAWILDRLPAEAASVLRWVARHHDDGWVRWDRQPGMSSAGRPLSFLEMAPASSNAIWTESIEAAASYHPLAGHLVAQHFLDLRRTGDSIDEPAGRAFQTTFQPRSDAWLQTWLLRSSSETEQAASRDAAERCRQLLQLFDWLSLLLCCGPVTQREDLPSASEQPLTLLPITDRSFQLDPWPCRPRQFDVSAACRSVPARAYASVQELEQAATPGTLQFRLQAE